MRKIAVVIVTAAAVLVIKVTRTAAADMDTEFQRKNNLSTRTEPGLQSNSNSKANKCSFFPSRLLTGGS